MRLMETIRRKGGLMLAIFLGFFLVSIFAGLGVGMFSFQSCDQLGLNQPEELQSSRTYLVNEGGWDGTPLKVNGEPISEDRYFMVVNRVLDAMGTGNDNDPAMQLAAFTYTMDALVREQTLLQRGEELGITVTSAEINEAKEQAISQFLGTDDGPSGNIVGDLAKGLGAARDRKAAFKEFLQRNGMDENEWRDQVKRELFIRNTTEAIQNAADEKKKVRAEEKKAQVDEALEGGMEFTEAARLYSDDPSADNGGDIGTWVQRGLLYDEEIENELFDTPVGEATRWFDIPAGYQRFYVYDKVEAEGEEFESRRDALVAAIKTEKGDDYEPTEEEIARQYQKVKFYQIMLMTSDTVAAQNEAQQLVDAATVEINDPLALAGQALAGDKLQPPLEVTMDDLVVIAKNTAATEDYDFSLIQDMLDRAHPLESEMEADTEEPAAEAAPETESADEMTGDDAAAEDDGAATGEDEAAAEGEEAPAEDEIPDLGFPEEDLRAAEDDIQPVYALAIGMMKVALQTDEESGATLNNYLVGKTYLEWLDDTDHADTQPLDRQQARTEVEENLARATETYNYNPLVYALRGVNLAWLDRDEEAHEALENAQKYAPQQQGIVWDTIREGYSVMDDEEKLEQIDEIITALRQEALRQAIEQNQQGGNNASTNTIDFGNLDLGGEGGPIDVTGAETDGEDDAAADDEAGAEDGEAGADTGGDAGAGDEPAEE